MAEPQNFRSAFNGFNREDVVHYLEYLNSKHQTQVNQLTAENEELRSQLSRQPEEDLTGLVESLQAQCAELTAQLEEANARCADLEQQLSQQAPEEPEAPVLSPSAAEELEAYRRAERVERQAKERTETMYQKANGVLADATAKVDDASAQITGIADQVAAQLTVLQQAVTGSKAALKDAAATLYTIRLTTEE